MSEHIGHPPEDQPTLERSAGPLSVGRVLGRRYEIRRLLGRGGMGEVWLAYDLRLRIEIALKVMHGWALEPARARELLRREVRQARAVVSPNVCRVFDLVELELGSATGAQGEPGEEVVSMEYVDGVTLLDYLRESGSLEVAEATRIATQMLAGLEAIHEAGLVHRDVKPENIMITRAGRVVLMDFGIARGLAEEAGTIAGTPAYMAPEQRRGEALDARADVFAAGVVLAEMMGADQMGDATSRQKLWTGLHHQPPQVPEGPWEDVVGRSVAEAREQRYPSASALARALEEVTPRGREDDDQSPYPGLAAFTEERSEHFFGREAEVEAVWKKLNVQHLLALVGASGAGKSSFLRAGLGANAPDGWSCVICSPGEAPFRSLAEALVPVLSGDDEAMRLLVGIEEEGRAVAACRQWRQGAREALLVVDQFEELFTLCSPEVQARFSELLGQVAIEAEVHVLVSMRDDFLLHCHDHVLLQPLFSELTPLKAPSGSALRRAIVQPALACGYRFEDETLVDEMLAEVTDERGALPLLAFAAASLWQRRDRERGLLTRAAYEEIGGVSGALAQHAEATLERIGPGGTELVRELLRNLVTAEGTRAVRERDELLSVFADRRSAEEVLDALIDARLLTSFEVNSEPTASDEGTRQRVEIIHESLLSAWPRLVHWQTLDEGAAQQRDQLRQAARLWQERGRPDDLLWSGTSFKEFEHWHESYSGGLSSSETAFAQAMVQRAEWRRRRRLVAFASVLLIAVAVATVTAVLWRRSESARRLATAAELRAQAQLQIDSYPTAALAYVTESLEAADTPAGRDLAREILWRAPPVRVQRLLEVQGAETGGFRAIEMSADGEWLATSTANWHRGMMLVPSNGGEPTRLELPFDYLGTMAFVESAGVLAVEGAVEGEGTEGERWKVFLLSVPEGELRSVVEVGEDFTAALLRDDRYLTLTRLAETGSEHLVRSWPLEAGGSATDLGWVHFMGYGDIDRGATRLASVSERTLYLHDLGGTSGREESNRVLVREHENELVDVTLSHQGDRAVLRDGSGRYLLWALDGESIRPERVLESSEHGDLEGPAVFDPTGRRVAWNSGNRSVGIWNLEAPPDADAVTRLIRRDDGFPGGVHFDPTGRWIVAAHGRSLSFWPLEWPWTRLFDGHSAEIQRPPAFSASGETALTCSTNGAGVWSLVPGNEPMQLVGGEEAGYCSDVATHPTEELAAVVFFSGNTVLLSLKEGEIKEVAEFSRPVRTGTIAFDPQGRRVVQFVWENPSPTERINSLLLWSLESGDVEAEVEIGESFPLDLEFAPDGRIYLAGENGIRRWDPESGELSSVLEAENATLDLHPAGHELLMSWGEHDQESSRGAMLNTRLAVLDLASGSRREIATHGSDIQQVAFGPAGRIIVTGDRNGTVRVGLATGEVPHLLPGLRARISGVAVAPDGRSVWATAGVEVRQWSMPDLSRPPLHTLPIDDLLGKLRSFTNLYVAEASESETGWSLEIGPFAGWQETPAW